MRKRMYQDLVNGRSLVKRQDPVPSEKAETNRQRWHGPEFTQTEKHTCRLGWRGCLVPWDCLFPPTSFLLPEAFSSLITNPLIWKLSDVSREQRNSCYISHSGWSDQPSLTWDSALQTPSISSNRTFCLHLLCSVIGTIPGSAILRTSLKLLMKSY